MSQDRLQKLDLLRDRINRIEVLSSERELNHEVEALHNRVQMIHQQLPELQSLTSNMPIFPDLTGTEETKQATEHAINLILNDYTEIKHTLEEVIELNAFQLNSLNLEPIDLTELIKNRVILIRLSEGFFLSCVKCLVLLEKFVQFSQEQNQFLIDVNDQLRKVSNQINNLPVDEY